MKMQRKVTLVLATGAMALGAGHYVQNKAALRTAAEPPEVRVTSVEPVAAGPADFTAPTGDAEQAALPADASPVPDAAPVDLPAPDRLAAADPMPEPQAPIAAPQPPAMAQAPECAITLDLVPQPDAMMALSLLAPCHPEERVVLRHAGLAVTAKTSATGAIVSVLPAMTPLALVEASFGNGDKASAILAVPEAANVQRFGVQWQQSDSFQLHAFENGAGYDQPGHISAAFTGTPGQTGFVTLLGDASTELPLLAEVYTFGPSETVDVVLEAAITAQTCNREILGETILSIDGKVSIADLTVAMPGCDAVGDILVLKNILQDMTVASAN